VRARSLLASASAVALLLVLGACSDDDAPPPDDGSQGLPLAGLRPAIESAGVDVIRPEEPAGATGAEVVAALDGVVDDATSTLASDVDDGYVAIDPTATAGLVSVVGPERGDPVVLVFADPAAAAVFAAGDPTVLTGAGRRDPDVYLAGNLVAFVGRESGDGDRVRLALAGLSGAPTEPASPTPSDAPG
jgi:hypothetical protein